MRYQFVTGHYEDDGSIRAYARGEDGKKQEIKVLGFRPYFYVDSTDTLLDETNPTQDGFNGVYGRSLKRVYVSSPKVVPNMRMNFIKPDEADIIFMRRWLVDTRIRSGFEAEQLLCSYKDLKPSDFSLPPRKCYLDIETYTRTRFPNPENPDQEVTCLGFWDDIHKTYISTLLSRHAGKEKLSDEHILYRISSERELLISFFNYLRQLDPDVLVTWGEFDFNYLIPRARRLRVDYSVISRFCILDLCGGYAKMYKSPSNRLKDVAFAERIIDYIPDDIIYADVYDKNPLELVALNKHHVEWMKKVNDKKANGNLTGFYWNVKNFVGLEDLENIEHTGVYIDTLLLRKYHGVYVLPSRPDREDIKHESEKKVGGLVKFPPIGIFEDVAVFDMSRYYQSILIALNLTPETTDKLGLVPQVAQDLMDERDKYEAILKGLIPGTPEYISVKSMRDTVKFVGEALIGYFGEEDSRLYSLRIYNSVTTTAQKGLLKLEKKLNDSGYKVIYYDTDGVFVLVPIDKLEIIQDLLTDCLQELSAELGSTRKFKIKCDKFFKRFLVKGVKKRYAGHVILEDGRPADYIHITGFEYVRRDQSKISHDVQKFVFDEVLKGDKANIKPYLDEVVDNIEKGRYSLRDIAVGKAIRKSDIDRYKNLDWIRGVRYANKYLKAGIIAGDSFKMLYVDSMGGSLPSTDVVCFLDEGQLPRSIKVDYRTLIDKTITAKIEDILDIANIKWKPHEVVYADMSGAWK